MRTTQVPSSAAAETSRWYAISRAEIDLFVHALMTAYEVVGVQEKHDRLTLARVEDPTAICLEFPPQVHSPKKFLFPNWQKLFRFSLDGKVHLEAEKMAQPRVIFGMHPCDLHAVQVLDDCLFEGEVDTVYQAKREATVLIGVDCVPDEHCFCSSVGTGRVASGFDLFIHKTETAYLVQTGSVRGADLLARYAPRVAERDEEPPLPLQEKGCDQELDFGAEALAPLLDEVYEHRIWKEIGGECLGCSACTLLCPTCYCFNIEDRLDGDLAGGERVRTWDSCQFENFTAVAGGDSFRPDQSDRQRHRFFRKYKYLWEKHQRTACVGCGRCSRECLARIEPVAVLNRLFGEDGRPELKIQPASEYQPQLAEITAVEELTERDKSFRLKLAEPLVFSPGAFVAVSVFGLGEAPFTIASTTGDGRHFDIVVRAQGSLTQALHRLQPGDSIGVRGPFGTGFPLEQMTGRDILLVAGGLGLVTLRSLIQALVRKRRDFGRVVLLYGARNVDQMLFQNDLLDWHRGGLLDCRFALSEPGNSWGVPTGEIPVLFKNLDLDPQKTSVAMSGPAGMYRFVNPILWRMGFDESSVFLNLERHMKCGLGKCGKCRINDVCVCEEGPIFPYSKVRHLKESIER